jgi:hypothetical protein
MRDHRLRFNEHGYATAFWAVFIGAVMIPLLVLVWDVGRLFYARGEVQKAADAAALAAAQEVDVQHYAQYRELVLHRGALVQAYHYAIGNIEFLPGADIYPTIDRVVVNNDTKTVWVLMSANADPLFPAWLRPGPISAWGEAQARVGAE